jgi:hypothetical protein
MVLRVQKKNKPETAAGERRWKKGVEAYLGYSDCGRQDVVETDHGRGRGHGRHAGEPKRYKERDQEVCSIPNPIRPTA